MVRGDRRRKRVRVVVIDIGIFSFLYLSVCKLFLSIFGLW